MIIIIMMMMIIIMMMMIIIMMMMIIIMITTTTTTIIIIIIIIIILIIIIITISELGRRISVVTGDMREATFLFQRLSIAIQRFNCILFKISFIDGEYVPASFLFE